MNPATTPTGFPAQPAFYTPVAWGPIFGLPAPVWSRGTGLNGSKIISTTGDYSFAQGIGALGGGNITINAGGSITDLSAVIASNGYQTSAAVNPANASNLVIQGGGDLVVRSGGNIGVALGDLDMHQNSSNAGGGGGVYYVARGRGDIATVRLTSAPGSVTAEMAMDDAVVSVRSGGDLKLAPFDPMVENQVFANRNNFSLANLTQAGGVVQMRSYEFGYTSRTDLDETSLAGDILPAFSPFNPGAPVNAGGASVTPKTPDYKFLHHEWADITTVPATGTLEYALPSLTGDQIAQFSMSRSTRLSRFCRLTCKSPRSRELSLRPTANRIKTPILSLAAPGTNIWEPISNFLTHADRLNTWPTEIFLFCRP